MDIAVKSLDLFCVEIHETKTYQIYFLEKIDYSNIDKYTGPPESQQKFYNYTFSSTINQSKGF